MEQLVEFAIGIVVSVFVGYYVADWALAQLGRELPAPSLFKTRKKTWKAIIRTGKGGCVLGMFERLLYFFAFWPAVDKVEIIGFYLAFKIASKWEVWKNIVQFPVDAPGPLSSKSSSLDWLVVKRDFGGWILTRFLTGTVVNVLMGALGAYVGSHAFEFSYWLSQIAARHA